MSILESEIREFLPDWNAEVIPSSDDRDNSEQLWQDDGTFEVVRRPDGEFRLTFFDQFRVDVDLSRRRIRIGDGSSMPVSAIRHFLADQVVPRILAHEGRFVIHSSAIADKGFAVLFIGPSRAGKSTLAAHFRAKGSALLGDDAINVEFDDGCPVARAIYRSLRLFPDSGDAVAGEKGGGMAIGTFTSKRCFSEGGEIRPQPAVPIRALILIDPDPCVEVRLKKLPPADACIALVEHSFWLDPSDFDQTRNRMALAGQVAAQLPAWRLSFPRDFDRLPDVQEAIVEILPR